MFVVTLLYAALAIPVLLFAIPHSMALLGFEGIFLSLGAYLLGAHLLLRCPRCGALTWMDFWVLPLTRCKRCSLNFLKFGFWSRIPAVEAGVMDPLAGWPRRDPNLLAAAIVSTVLGLLLLLRAGLAPEVSFALDLVLGAWASVCALLSLILYYRAIRPRMYGIILIAAVWLGAGLYRLDLLNAGARFTEWDAYVELTLSLLFFVSAHHARRRERNRGAT